MIQSQDSSGHSTHHPRIIRMYLVRVYGLAGRFKLMFPQVGWFLFLAFPDGLKLLKPQQSLIQGGWRGCRLDRRITMVQMWHAQTHQMCVCVRNIRIKYTLTLTPKEVSVYWVRIRYTLTPSPKGGVSVCRKNYIHTYIQRSKCVLN